jgi:uncharacterized protein YjbI with pentapeptide repeats
LPFANIVNVFKIKYGDTITELVPKIKEFIDSLSKYSDEITQAIESDDFKKVLKDAGLVGSTINLAISFYEIISSKEKDDSYYINKVALKVYKEASESVGIDLNKYRLEKEDEKKFLKSLFTKATEKDFTGGSSIYSHPIIVEFKNSLYNILKGQNEDYKWIDFVISFDVMLYEKVKGDSKYEKIKVKWKAKELIYKRKQYFKEVLEFINKKNTIDGKNLFSYYIENRLIELDHKEHSQLHYEDNIQLADSEYERIFDNSSSIGINKNRFDIDKFLNYNEFDNTRFIIAPFGNGKTSFAKHLARLYIKKFYYEAENRWFPIYISLKEWDKEVFYDKTLEELIRDIIKPQDENIFLICDGLDEYPNNKEELLKKINNVITKFFDNQTENKDIVINKYKRIVTTRPESSFSFKTVKKFARLLPFTPSQVDDFFSRYGLPEINWQLLKKYNIKDKENEDDLLRKPLFCWMFAIAYKNKDLEIQKEDENFQVLLYSSFIHSILKGRIPDNPDLIQYEKWILRKIAALKAIYKENLTDDIIKEKIEIFAKGEDNEKLQRHVIRQNKQNTDGQYVKKEDIDEKEYLVEPILSSYFRYNESSNRHIDFLHKSFEEYLLAEYIVECIVRDKWYRLEVGIPSNVTITLLGSLLDILKSNTSQQQDKLQNNIYNSMIFGTKATITNTTNFQTIITERSEKIFKSNKNIVINENLQQNELKPEDNEIWRYFYFDSERYKQSKFYLTIVLFILKKLSPKINPSNLKEFMENIDWSKINLALKYFPEIVISHANLSKVDFSFANLSDANLSDANLYKANLYKANLYKANLSDAYLSDAYLSDANLSKAKLSKANLSKAKLPKADLSDADLSNTNLSKANLSNANLSNTNISKADLSDAYLSFANLSNANLSFTNLSKADLSFASLSKADLSSTNLSNTNLSKADLFNTDLSKADLSNTNLSKVDLSKATLYKADLSDAYLSKVDLSDANLASADLSNSLLIDIYEFDNLILNEYSIFFNTVTNSDSLIEYIKNKYNSTIINISVESPDGKEQLKDKLKSKNYNDEDINKILASRLWKMSSNKLEFNGAPF